MRKYWIISILLLPIVTFSQLNPQSKKVSQKFFPEAEFEINTPAFQKKKGFTKYDEMLDYLTDIVNRNKDLIEISFIGESQKGKKIPMLVFNRSKGEESRVKVLLQGGLHGNEPASTEGLLYLMDQLVSNPDISHLFDRIELAIIPMANIDGYEKQNRYAANGLDLNRDQTKLNATETVSLKKAYKAFRPEVSVDFHEYRPYRRDFAHFSGFGITSIHDVMFLYSGNLNVPDRLRKYTEERFIENARLMLDKNQIRHRDYVSTTDVLGDIHFTQGSSNARSSATSWALTNTISALIEVRGVGIAKSSFKRRIKSTYLVALSFLETAYDHVNEIKNEIEAAKDIAGPAVVKSKPKVSKQFYNTIDLDKNEEIELEIILRDALKSTATLSRVRPAGYILLGKEKEALQKLRILGLNLEPLEPGLVIDVEKYKVLEYKRERMKYEGVKQQKVVTEVLQEKITLDSEAFYLSMDQKNANLAIELLEPEAANSFVNFAVIKTSMNAILPVYRVLEKPSSN